MPEPREFPYPNFAFRVKIGNDDENAILAGFQEVSGLGMEVAMSEYRAGNSKENVPQKVMGLGKQPDVTLKRGVMGATNLFDWIKALRDGDRSRDNYFRTVTVKLMAEDRQTAILEWKLQNARAMKYTGPSLNGKSSDIAIEELVLSVENITMKAAA
jgi:phage tail-like protein